MLSFLSLLSLLSSLSLSYDSAILRVNVLTCPESKLVRTQMLLIRTSWGEFHHDVNGLKHMEPLMDGGMKIGKSDQNDLTVLVGSQFT